MFFAHRLLKRDFVTDNALAGRDTDRLVAVAAETVCLHDVGLDLLFDLYTVRVLASPIEMILVFDER